jgi:hypothetical protein
MKWLLFLSPYSEYYYFKKSLNCHVKLRCVSVQRCIVGPWYLSVLRSKTRIGINATMRKIASCSTIDITIISVHKRFWIHVTITVYYNTLGCLRHYCSTVNFGLYTRCSVPSTRTPEIIIICLFRWLVTPIIIFTA